MKASLYDRTHYSWNHEGVDKTMSPQHDFSINPNFRSCHDSTSFACLPKIVLDASCGFGDNEHKNTLTTKETKKTMQDTKLIQMLLATMVTSQNINYAITNFAKNGTIDSDNERSITIAAIKGTFVGFLATLAISWLLASWQTYQRKHETMTVEVENDYEVASIQSISDDDSSTIVSSPRRFSPRLAFKNYQSMIDDEVDEMESTFDDSEVAEDSWISSPRKLSLRLALRKHRGWGSEWTNSGERYSLRICSPSHHSSN